MSKPDSLDEILEDFGRTASYMGEHKIKDGRLTPVLEDAKQAILTKIPCGFEKTNDYHCITPSSNNTCVVCGVSGV